MLKHVSSGQLRRRSSDMGSTCTLGSTGSAGSAGSGSDLSPPSSVRSEPQPARKPPVFTGVIKVFTGAVRPDMEYKTFIISSDTSSKDLVSMVLFKCKMRNRDPNLFYITMEVGIKKKGVPVRTMMVLEDEARPLVLQACHPRGESRFHLQQKRGGLVKVNVSCLSPGSQYKSLFVSERTSSVELIKLLLACYKVCDDTKHYSMHEVCSTDTGEHIYERKLSPEDCPLLIQQSWTNPNDFAFYIKRVSVSVFQRYRRPRRVQSADISDMYIHHQLHTLDMNKSSTSSLLPPSRNATAALLSSTTSLSSAPPPPALSAASSMFTLGGVDSMRRVLGPASPGHQPHAPQHHKPPPSPSHHHHRPNIYTNEHVGASRTSVINNNNNNTMEKGNDSSLGSKNNNGSAAANSAQPTTASLLNLNRHSCIYV